MHPIYSSPCEDFHHDLNDYHTCLSNCHRHSSGMGTLAQAKEAESLACWLEVEMYLPLRKGLMLVQ